MLSHGVVGNNADTIVTSSLDAVFGFVNIIGALIVVFDQSTAMPLLSCWCMLSPSDSNSNRLVRLTSQKLATARQTLLGKVSKTSQQAP